MHGAYDPDPRLRTGSRRPLHLGRIGRRSRLRAVDARLRDPVRTGQAWLGVAAVVVVVGVAVLSGTPTRAAYVLGYGTFTALLVGPWTLLAGPAWRRLHRDRRDPWRPLPRRGGDWPHLSQGDLVGITVLCVGVTTIAVLAVVGGAQP